MINCVKRWDNFPFAHRQPKHEGHCSLIHGHNWSFEFEFRTGRQDANGFVIDFGSLGWLKGWLDDRFDHTLVLNEDDPFLSYLKVTLVSKLPHLAKIIVVSNCGAEGLAEFLFESISVEIANRTNERVRLYRVTVFEDDRNSATYTR